MRPTVIEAALRRVPVPSAARVIARRNLQPAGWIGTN
jgi:hypothetical protein